MDLNSGTGLKLREQFQERAEQRLLDNQRAREEALQSTGEDAARDVCDKAVDCRNFLNKIFSDNSTNYGRYDVVQSSIYLPLYDDVDGTEGALFITRNNLSLGGYDLVIELDKGKAREELPLGVFNGSTRYINPFGSFATSKEVHGVYYPKSIGFESADTEWGQMVLGLLDEARQYQIDKAGKYAQLAQ